MKAPLPPNERERLAAPRQYEILDILPGQACDDITQLAAQICGTPIALVSLGDGKQRWFKSKVGLAASEIRRELAWFANRLIGDDLVEVPNFLKDPRFAGNPLVTSDPKIRFFAGTPLITSARHKIGMLCAMDVVPRRLTREQAENLRRLSRFVVEQLEARLRLESAFREVADHEQQRIRRNLHDGLGQQLTVLEMHCFVLSEDLAADDLTASRKQLKEHMQQISQSVHECITLTRALARGLVPAVLKNEGLMGALADLADRARKSGKIECRLVCPNAVRLDDFQKARHLYCIAEEAVNHALQHARIRRIEISLTHKRGLLRLQIKGDRRESPKRGEADAGMGLEILRHRAHVIGASLEIDSQPRKGLGITCTLPLKQK